MRPSIGCLTQWGLRGAVIRSMCVDPCVFVFPLWAAGLMHVSHVSIYILACMHASVGFKRRSGGCFVHALSVDGSSRTGRANYAHTHTHTCVPIDIIGRYKIQIICIEINKYVNKCTKCLWKSAHVYTQTHTPHAHAPH